MLALLLAVVSSPPSPVTPQVEIAFPNAAPIVVTGPENSEKNAEYPWKHEQTLLSPRQDAATVRFCWEIGKYDGCQVFLARPGQPTLRLKNSDVKRLLWTEDGKYLIGAGENTLRLWNLVGGARTAVPIPVPAFAPLQHTSQIVGLTLDGGRMCVRTEDQWYGHNSSQATRSVTTTRYALPTLKPRIVTTFPASRNRKEAECRPFNPSYQWP